MDNPYRPPDAPLGQAKGFSPRRTAAALTFGILNLIYGGIGLICNPVNGLGNAVAKTPPGGLPPGGNNLIFEIALRPEYRRGMVAFAAVGFVSCAILVTAGIGLLAMKAWGRRACLWYATLSLFATLCNLIFVAIYIGSPMLELAKTAKNAEQSGFAYGGIIGAVGVVFLAAIYPTVLLIFMTRRSVVASLEPARMESDMYY